VSQVNGPSDGLTPERRARLARKGEILYAKSCGTNGDCAEGFATYQMRIGNHEVVRDFLGFLERRLATLGRDDPEGLRERTEALIARVRGLLEGVDVSRSPSGRLRGAP
jgi:hypothetical protein